MHADALLAAIEDQKLRAQAKSFFEAPLPVAGNLGFNAAYQADRKSSFMTHSACHAYPVTLPKFTEAYRGDNFGLVTFRFVRLPNYEAFENRIALKLKLYDLGCPYAFLHSHPKKIFDTPEHSNQHLNLALAVPHVTPDVMVASGQGHHFEHLEYNRIFFRFVLDQKLAQEKDLLAAGIPNFWSKNTSLKNQSSFTKPTPGKSDLIP